MDKVVYRSLVKEDYEAVKTLIGEAFGFNEFIKDKKFLDTVLNIYLQGCILESSFSKVAEKNNKIIGVILGDAKKDKNHLKKAQNTLSFAYSMLKVIMTKKENKKFMKEFAKVQDAYKELIHGKEDDFQGCIQLFIVSGESRGLGVGKALMNHLINYMISMDVKSLYLYTDNKCNYGFYDSQNFERINAKEVYFSSTKDKLNVFLYCYDF
ncbi:GNAT family N-acetyltransferase [Rummeliibacillus pycnus]|uniref:GNAT family N-acetyltransferase n=1 Tax=Rummeliibacillus pycnus TaxID=101070 RepID=UPI0037C8589F